MKAGDRVVLFTSLPGSLTGMRGVVVRRNENDGRGRIYKVHCEDGLLRNVLREHIRRVRVRRSRRAR